MTLLKKNDPRRKWRAFKRHAILLSKTFVFATATTLIWYAIWTRGYHFTEDDNDILIGAVIMTLGVLYGVEVAWILTTILEKYHKIVIAVLQKNKHEFLLYRDERMPIAVHILIGAVSLPLLGMIGTIAFKHLAIGIVSIFSVSVILVLFWFVAAKLEDPINEGWFKERIPQDWYDADIDEYFGLGPEKKK